MVGQPNEFDVELLGDCDAVVSEICGRLGWDKHDIETTTSTVKLSSQLAATSTPAASTKDKKGGGGGEEFGGFHSVDSVSEQVLLDEVAAGNVVQHATSTYLFRYPTLFCLTRFVLCVGAPVCL